MSQAIVHCDHFEVSMDTGPDIANITEALKEVLQASTVQWGSLSLTSIGSTGSVTAIEYEPGVVQDLKRAINELAPPGQVYAHEQAWHDGNGHSHVQAALMGPSMTLPVRDGALVLGTWQQVVLVNHDNHGRSRRVEVTVIGRA